MYCSNCGKEISSDQRYCCHCAAENRNYVGNAENSLVENKSATQIQKVAQQNNTFDRNVLVNYLFDIQTLHFAKRKIEEEKGKIKKKIETLCIPKFVKENDPIYKSMGFITSIIVSIFGIFLIAVITSTIKENGEFNEVQKVVVAALFMIFAIATVYFMISGIRDYKDDKERFEKESEYEEKRMEEENEQKNELIEMFDALELDLANTEKLLEEAYKVNIIPTKCRNIYGAYFLYDYISTSMVSLDDALFHFDFDEVVSELREVVRQQGQIIMELAYANALNEQIVKQNDEQLRHTIAMERNAELTAKYTQVAAFHAKTTSQIQSYNFFKSGL